MSHRSADNNQTLKQIAQDLKLSQMSVSRALHGQKGVSDETRRLVQEYARRIHYRPNLAARALAQRKTQTLGVIFPSLRQTFWADIVLGIEQAAKAGGYSVLMAHSNDRDEVEREEIRTLLARQVDALLIASSNPDANADLLAQASASRPVVLFDRYAESLDVPGVFCDDRAGGRQATEHLIGLGYKRVAHLAGPPTLSVARDRRRGYQDAMRAAGLAESTAECGFGEEAGRTGMRALLDGAAPPEAVFAAHDPIAFGVLDVCKERGLRVPADLALISYTDVDHAHHLAVPLTVMAQPTFEMGQATARLALDLLAGRTPASTRVVLPARLIVRESCGARADRPEGGDQGGGGRKPPS